MNVIGVFTSFTLYQFQYTDVSVSVVVYNWRFICGLLEFLFGPAHPSGPDGPLRATSHTQASSANPSRYIDMEEDKRQDSSAKNGGCEILVVREFEPADKPRVHQIFSEGMMEMIPDVAFRGLIHHPESLLLYSAMTGKNKRKITHLRSLVGVNVYDYSL